MRPSAPWAVDKLSNISQFTCINACLILVASYVIRRAHSDGIVQGKISPITTAFSTHNEGNIIEKPVSVSEFEICPETSREFMGAFGKDK